MESHGENHPSIKTWDDVQNLIADWRADPCWDLEATEGFEFACEYLKGIRLNLEAEWESLRRAKIWDKAQTLGCENNLLLAEYILNLEARIERLEKKGYATP